MTINRHMALGLALAASLLAGAAQAKEPAKGGYTLNVTVTGAKTNTGIVRAALFSDPEAFPDGNMAQSTQAALDGKDTVHLTFKGLKSGAYAISLYHDADGDDKFDKAVLGLPEESYGFSNINEAVMSKPSSRRPASRSTSRPA